MLNKCLVLCKYDFTILADALSFLDLINTPGTDQTGDRSLSAWTDPRMNREDTLTGNLHSADTRKLTPEHKCGWAGHTSAGHLRCRAVSVSK